MNEDEIREEMQMALDGANARSARRLAWLLDRILPIARTTFAEGEPLPDFMIEAEETTMAVLGKEPVLGEPVHIDASDEELAETPSIPQERSDTLEGALFRAASLTEKINAHRIAGLEPPQDAIIARDFEIAALKRHLCNDDRRMANGIISRIRAFFSSLIF